MFCAEENRLRMFHDDALHRWARAQAGLRFKDASRSRTEMFVQELADDRDAALNRFGSASEKLFTVPFRGPKKRGVISNRVCWRPSPYCGISDQLSTVSVMNIATNLPDEVSRRRLFRWSAEP
jgi:hypothetical protein